MLMKYMNIKVFYNIVLLQIVHKMLCRLWLIVLVNGNLTPDNADVRADCLQPVNSVKLWSDYKTSLRPTKSGLGVQTFQ